MNVLLVFILILIYIFIFDFDSFTFARGRARRLCVVVSTSTRPEQRIGHTGVAFFNRSQSAARVVLKKALRSVGARGCLELLPFAILLEKITMSRERKRVNTSQKYISDHGGPCKHIHCYLVLFTFFLSEALSQVPRNVCLINFIMKQALVLEITPGKKK